MFASRARCLRPRRLVNFFEELREAIREVSNAGN
jgi:hypothetical protein